MAFSLTSLTIILLAAASSVQASPLETRNNCSIFQLLPVDLSNLNYANQCPQADNFCRCVQFNPDTPDRPNRIFCLDDGSCNNPGIFLGNI